MINRILFGAALLISMVLSCVIIMLMLSMSNSSDRGFVIFFSVMGFVTVSMLVTKMYRMFDSAIFRFDNQFLNNLRYQYNRLFSVPAYDIVKEEDSFGVTYYVEGPASKVNQVIGRLKEEFPVNEWKTSVTTQEPFGFGGSKAKVWRTSKACLPDRVRVRHIGMQLVEF